MEQQQMTAEQIEQVTAVSTAVEKSLERCRQDVGELVSKLGDANEHPLGVALALAMAGATVIASMGVATGMPMPAVQVLMTSLMEEAKKVGEDAYVGLSGLKLAGITPEQANEIRAKNAAKQAAND